MRASVKNIFFDSKMKLFLLLVVVVGLAMIFFGPQKTLDTKLYYSAEEAKAFLQGLTPGQITTYLNNEILDLFFIVFYSAAAYLLLFRLITKNKILAMAALVPGLIDLFETVFIIHLLATSAFTDVPSYLGAVTLLKWITGGVLIIILFFGSFVLLKPDGLQKGLRDQI